MRELLRTNDLVHLSWATALLQGAGIEAIILDTHTSVLEGSVSAIQRRLMVIDDDYSRASYLIARHTPEPLGTEAD